MTKLLVPIGFGQSDRLKSALEQAIRIHRVEQAAVHLLAVQPRVNGHVAAFFGTHELLQLQQDAGDEDLAPARALLDAAGVPYTASVMVGRSAETIAHAATELGCDRIVMGDAVGGVAQKVFGSLAAQVRHMVSGGCVVIGS